jgi:hypothetical protein
VAETLDLGRFEGLVTDQLPHACIDAVEVAQDLHRPIDASRPPTRDGLQLGKHRIKTFTQVAHYVIGIGRKPMAGVQSRSGSAHQHGIRQNALQVGCA